MVKSRSKKKKPKNKEQKQTTFYVFFNFPPPYLQEPYKGGSYKKKGDSERQQDRKHGQETNKRLGPREMAQLRALTALAMDLCSVPAPTSRVIINLLFPGAPTLPSDVSRHQECE